MTLFELIPIINILSLIYSKNDFARKSNKEIQMPKILPSKEMIIPVVLLTLVTMFAVNRIAPLKSIVG